MPEQSASPSDENGSSRRRMLIAAIVALVVLIAAGTLAVVLLKGGGAPTEVPTVPSAHPETSAGPETPTSGPSPSPSPSATTPAAVPPSAEDRQFFLESLQSGNTAALEGRFADTVQVVIAASDCCGPLGRGDALGQLSYVQPGTTATWDFTLDESTLTAYRSGFYGQYFPVEAIVGVSSDGFVASFLPAADGEIVTLFMAMTASL